jgi:hypothetical protein
MSGDVDGEMSGEEGLELLGESVLGDRECPCVIGIANSGIDAKGSLTPVLSTFMSVGREFSKAAAAAAA